MSAFVELFWRLLPDVRRGERSRFLFFAGLFTLISVAQTLGLAGSEALFLAHLGASKLPQAFVGASLVTVLGSLIYAARVGVVRNDLLFLRMSLTAGVLLGILAGVAAGGTVWVVPLLFCLFYLTQAIFLNHFWTFAGDYFDTVASKRHFPLFTVGSSLGGVIGGVLAVLTTAVAGAVSLIAAWGIFLALAGAMLRLGRRRLRRWGPLELEEADETSVEGLQAALRYLRASALGRWLVVSALGMVLALFLVQYLYSDIFARRFPDPGELAAFFGIYLAVTNVIEIGVERTLTPWLIRRFGVTSANLLHPVLTILSFGGLAYHTGLSTGIAARANRELIENSMAIPLRHLVYNAIPSRFRGRMRAFLEGMVVNAGMAVAGAVLLILSDPDPALLCGAGAIAALLYLIANIRARREYLRALVDQLRTGRLDLAEVGDEIGGWEVSRLAQLWEVLLREEGSKPSRPLLQLVPNLASRGITEPLIRAMAHPSADVRRSCVNALSTSEGAGAREAIERAIEDSDASVRLAALRGLLRGEGDPDGLAAPAGRLTGDPDPRVRVEASLHAGPEGLETLARMIRSPSSAEATAALSVAPSALTDTALARVRDPDPAIRAAALECAARVAKEPPLCMEDLKRALADPDVRVRRAAVLLLASLEDEGVAEAVASALADSAPEVQFAAATVLGALEEEGLAAAAPYLGQDREHAVQGALRVAAASDSPRARELLSRELQRRVRGLWYDVVAYQHLPEDSDLAAHFLRAAYADDMLRGRRIAFRILEALENERVIQNVDRVLRFGSPRARGDALEVLSNLGDRESAELLVLVHEAGSLQDRARVATRLISIPRETDEVLERSRHSDVRWIRMGARAYAGACDAGERETMERLLALKQVPLFRHLSLEQLEAVHQITNEVTYLPGEVIVKEGDPGGELYLLLEGNVQVFKDFRTPSESLLGTQSAVSYFGEMAILDDEARSATVVAADRVRLLSLDGRSLKDLVLQMPEISFEIFRVLTARVRTAERRLKDA